MIDFPRGGKWDPLKGQRNSVQLVEKLWDVRKNILQVPACFSLVFTKPNKKPSQLSYSKNNCHTLLDHIRGSEENPSSGKEKCVFLQNSLKSFNTLGQTRKYEPQTHRSTVTWTIGLSTKRYDSNCIITMMFELAQSEWVTPHDVISHIATLIWVWRFKITWTQRKQQDCPEFEIRGKLLISLVASHLFIL